MAIAQATKKMNISVIIEGIKFDIVDISQDLRHQQITFNNLPMYIPTHPDIKITAKTSTSNYTLLEKWMYGSMSLRPISNCKKDIFIGSLKIFGVFPIDITFNNNYIDVTLSADHIIGDLNQTYLQFQRKEKLKKLEDICQK